MRIGIGVHRRRMVAVCLPVGGAPTMHEARVGADGFEAALDRLLARAAPHPHPVRSLAFDLSAVLLPAARTPLTVVRIAPRPPARSNDESQLDDARIVHVRGGHTTLGEELAGFDVEGLRSAAKEIPDGSRVVVTGVGSLVSPQHELAAGEVLLDHGALSSITFSHIFASGSFATRERTAVVDSALTPAAEELATSLTLVAGGRLPSARLSVMRNDGGRVPLSRLPLAPVHSAFSGVPAEFLGAAGLCRLDDGSLVAETSAGLLLGSLRSGAPTVIPRLHQSGGRLATQSAHLVPASELLLGGRRPAPLVVRTENAELPRWLDAETVLDTDLDLRALGAACAPLTDWELGTVSAGNPAEMAHELSSAAARVRTRLASFGALPSSVRILESRLVATTYEHARVISVRVHGVAGDPVGGMVSKGGPHATGQ